jgi:medium-chain acyl-[acyl-carrier-protein] hydrolase
LPGRESRAAEEPFDAMPALVQALTGAIEPLLDRPYAFFGHSMGAAVAFELARALRKRGAPMPAVLIASAARAPQFRRGWTPPPEPPDETFKEELRRLQGAPDQALDDPVMLRAILPVLRADTRLYRNYLYGEDEPLELPIRAYGGAEDPNITRDHLQGWREQTRRSFDVRIFPGGHFFLHASRAQLLDALSDDLESLC